MAGIHQYSQFNASNIGNFAYYRSSSPKNLTDAYNLYLNNSAGSIDLKDSRVYGHGLSLRCFKNTTAELPVPLTGAIIYSTTGTTYSAVLATLHFNTTGVTIDNNGGKNFYLFKQNGNFTFFFHDQIGNTGEITAEVDRILNAEWNYGGTGSIQTFIAPYDGDYMLEARGAKGGDGAGGVHVGGN
ncbi:MAG: hypothetical protein LBI53_00160 [Candidatus Peribacteria bacterium]|jgi:hypothetical protein|nr:hypothetical protein [Candidatus Peribacteria bacterium]